MQKAETASQVMEGAVDRTTHAMGGLVCAGLFLFILSLPPFHFGLSVQTETAAAGLHAIAAGLALCGAVLLFRGEVAVGRWVRDPLFLLLLLLVAWSMLAGALSGRLLESLSGPLDLGAGGLAILEGGIICLATRHVLGVSVWRWGIAGSAVIAFVAILALDATGRASRSMAPYYFGDYIAFVAFAFLAIVVSLSGDRRRIALALAVPLAVWAIIQSGNKAGLLGFALMVVVGVAAWQLPDRFRKHVYFLPVLLTIAMPVSIYAVGSAYVPEDFDRLINAYGHALVPAFLLSVWASIWSRAMLLKVSFAGILDGSNGIAGSGWGSFGDALVRHLRVVDSRHHELVGDTLTYWDAIQRTDFHSHNFMTETLLAGGPVAAVIVLVMLWRLARSWRDSSMAMPLAWLAGLVPVASFWFQLPLTIAWLAVAIAAMIPGARDDRPGRVAARGTLPGACALLVGLLLAFVAGTAMRDTLKAGDLLRSGMVTAEISASCGKANLTTWHTDSYLAQLISVQAERFSFADDEGGRQLQGERLSALVCHAQNRIAQSGSLRLVSTMVNATGLLRFTSAAGAMSGPVRELVDRWDGLADDLLLLAPGRTDLLIPYFNHLLLEGREERLQAVTDDVLESSPGEPVALWFSGLVLLGSENSASGGMERLKAAARNGIADLMPVPDELRDSLGLPKR